MIATRDHLPSMLDLNVEQRADLIAFTEQVQDRLAETYGPTVIAEHGRVAPCVAPAARRHEPHCLHAHRLVFPGLSRMNLADFAPNLEVDTYSDFETLSEQNNTFRQYLYVEDQAGCHLGKVDGPLPRQFLRGVAALLREEPHLADWRAAPGFDQVRAAQALLVARALA